MLLLSRSNRLLCFSFVYFFAVFAVALYGLFRFIRTISSIRCFRYAYSLFNFNFQVQYPGYSSHSISSQLRNRNSLKSRSNWLFLRLFAIFTNSHWLYYTDYYYVFFENSGFFAEQNLFFPISDGTKRFFLQTNRLRNKCFSLKFLRNKKVFSFKFLRNKKSFFFLKFCSK